MRANCSNFLYVGCAFIALGNRTYDLVAVSTFPWVIRQLTPKVICIKLLISISSVRDVRYVEHKCVANFWRHSFLWALVTHTHKHTHLC